MRDEFGPAIVMERLLNEIEAAVEHNHVVIDGLRQIEELGTFTVVPAKNDCDCSRGI